MSCSVCTNIYRDPKQLSCLHSFCLQCLKRWHRETHGRDTIRCPKCQTISRVRESSDLKDLPTSFYLNSLIDVLAIKECKTSQVKCRNCDNTRPESSYCFQCCAFYCQECLIGHNILKSYKDHRVLALEAFQDEDYEDVMKRPAFCRKEDHNNKELEYFCKSCEMPVCQFCVTVDHESHDKELIKKEAEKQKSEMKSLIEKQRRNLQAKMEAVKKIDEEVAELTQHGEDVKRHVQTFVDSLLAVIETKKQDILSSVDEESSKSRELYKERKNRIQQQIAVIESSLETADKLLSRSTTNAEIVQLKKLSGAIFKGVDQTEPINRNTKIFPTGLVFEENQKLVGTFKTERIGTLLIKCELEGRQSTTKQPLQIYYKSGTTWNVPGGQRPR